MENQHERLRRARKEAGYSTAQGAIDAFGFPGPAYRHHENGTRGIPPVAAKRYAKAFKVNPGWLLGLDIEQFPKSKPEPVTLVVEGAVAAGIWREQTEWPEDDKYEIEVGPSPLPGAERFAVRMDGYSMDKIIPPGSNLECARVGFGDITPQVGDLVIASREAHGLFEMTCKRLDVRDGDWVLCPESTRPEFQEVIRVGRANAELQIDNGVSIIGVVLRAHQSHFRRLN